MYVDLERLIDECKFSPREMAVLDDLMYGYTPSDIGDRYAVTRQSVEVFLKRAVRKIVRRNNEHWHEVHDEEVCENGS